MTNRKGLPPHSWKRHATSGQERRHSRRPGFPCATLQSAACEEVKFTAHTLLTRGVLDTEIGSPRKRRRKRRHFFFRGLPALVVRNTDPAVGLLLPRGASSPAVASSSSCSGRSASARPVVRPADPVIPDDGTKRKRLGRVGRGRMRLGSSQRPIHCCAQATCESVEAARQTQHSRLGQ